MTDDERERNRALTADMPMGPLRGLLMELTYARRDREKPSALAGAKAFWLRARRSEPSPALAVPRSGGPEDPFSEAERRSLPPTAAELAAARETAWRMAEEGWFGWPL